jgi:hypothetical protein
MRVRPALLDAVLPASFPSRHVDVLLAGGVRRGAQSLRHVDQDRPQQLLIGMCGHQIDGWLGGPGKKGTTALLKSVRKMPGRGRVRESVWPTVIVLAMLMAYSVVLLWWGLSVTAIAWLTAALASVAVGVVSVEAMPPHRWLQSAARRALRAAATEPDAAAAGPESTDECGSSGTPRR